MKFLILLCCISFTFANDILLLSKLNEGEIKTRDFDGYLMSEKLDGVRGIWDGKSLQTRQKNIINSPKFFTQNFPKFALDGELWISRAKFDEISALIRSSDVNSSLWKSVSYNVFDVPNACEDFKLNPCTLETRLRILKQYLEKNHNPYIKIIPQIPIKNSSHLEKFYNNIIQNKGEGVVIRKNLSLYEKGRSKEAMKLKPYDDAECEVVGYVEGRGKFKNQIGSLLCKMPNDKVIKIGSGLKNKDRENPPKIGSIITYKFNGLTKNSLPRFPIFLRLRDENP